MSDINIKFLRKHTIPNSGVSVGGLAYKPITDTFFCINKNGFDPFVLQEIKILPSGNVTVVKVWGAINNAADKLGMAGRQLVAMKGLVYDEEKNGLWCSYGSFYANGANLPFLCFVQLNADGTITVYGPWKVNSSVHSDKVKGMLMRSRPGYFYAFGARGSTSQGQSWGIGLVEVKEPDVNLPALSELEAKVLIHWPMKAINGIYQSDFPLVPGTSSTYIKGNDNCNPLSAKYSYEYNAFSTVVGGASVGSLCSIDNSLYYFGGEAHGYQWYGNQYSHNDPSPSGIYYNNNLDSQLYPGRKVVSAVSPRGGHFEAMDAVWFEVKENNIPVTQTQLSYDDAGRIEDFGFKIVDSLVGYIGQAYYNQTLRLLYLLNYGPDILVFEVSDKIVDIDTGFENLKISYNMNLNESSYINDGYVYSKQETFEQAQTTAQQIKNVYDTVDHSVLDFIEWQNLVEAGVTT